MKHALIYGMVPCLALAACVSAPPHSVMASRLAAPVWQPRAVVADAHQVPGGRLHIVKAGETGIAIARAYGVSWSSVVAANNLRAPYVLEVGQKLLLPTAKAAAAQVAAMSIEQRAAAFSVKIDDLITGAEPARSVPRAKPPLVSARPTLAMSAPPLTPALFGAAPVFAWPVEGRVLSSFGAKPGGRYNDGVNLKTGAGDAVRAAADGVVAYAGNAIPGFGNLLLIKHSGGWVTAYGHNEALLVERGVKVRGGEVIARAGATGSVTAPQLHFEVRRGRVAVDPQSILPPRG